MHPLVCLRPVANLSRLTCIYNNSLYYRQDASPEAVRQHSWNAESGTSGQGPDPALTGVVQNAHGGGAVIGKGGVRERTTDQGSHRQQQQLQHQLSQDAPTLECPLCLLELDREFFPKVHFYDMLLV